MIDDKYFEYFVNQTNQNFTDVKGEFKLLRDEMAKSRDFRVASMAKLSVISAIISMVCAGLAEVAFTYWRH